MRVVTRRQCLTAAAAGAIGCGRRATPGYSGFAFVANSEGAAVAAVSLAAFAVIKHIRLDANPTQLTAHPSEALLYALTPGTGAIHRISGDKLAVTKTVAAFRGATQMRLAPAGDALYVLSPSERALWRVNLSTLETAGKISLGEGAGFLELAAEAQVAAVSYPERGHVALIDLDAHRVLRTVSTGRRVGPVGMLKNGRLLLAGDPERRQIAIVETLSGRTVVELPIPIKPERFCFKRDGGQMFVTGSGSDAVVIVYPFQTQVAGTILAGRAPGAMAAMSAVPGYLLVANSSSGEVTMMDLATQKIRAVVPVGKRPDFITLTPDEEFALVLNRDSGDMAVIRVGGMQPKRTKQAALLTMVPVGSGPVDAVVMN